jgi:AcrR family transcriptional regulator
MSVTAIAYTSLVSRWEPNARGRLEAAALELYVEQGFDRTTVAEIAECAGLTERTFFRYFADKREVLFWGEGVFHDTVVEAVRSAPRDATPLDTVAIALGAAAAMFEPRRELAGKRHAVISSHDGLRERELIKLDSTATAIAAELRERGVKQPVAELAAQTGVAVFKVAFERWIAPQNKRKFAQLVSRAFDELKTVAQT